MKIIEAVREGDISYVQVKHNGVHVTMQKEGSLFAIKQNGRGNVRFAKSQAKQLHYLLNGK
ncbi:hypothetical protein [Pantoea ananatis]|uniref:hypothetical protein n=1 Tax=Pantoea ananas TaxID=553 RepID=UPI001B317926|nr:hypothetical protein [Pantoea ananatis]